MEQVSYKETLMRGLKRNYGFFGDFTLGFKNYVFLSFSGRNDWTSTYRLKTTAISIQQLVYHLW
jgi:hypothetical protein